MLTEAHRRQNRRLPEQICAVCRQWAWLDAAIAPALRNASSHGETLSGGLFLYEHQMQAALRMVAAIVESHGSARVCESGFNAGHASLLWLTLPNVTVTSFDRFARPYQRVARRLLHERYGDRLTTIEGDSELTVRAHAKSTPRPRCDFVHPSVPGREYADLVHFRQMATERTTGPDFD